MIQTQCPLCNSKSKETLYFNVNKELEFVEVVTCSRCSHVYTYFDLEIDANILYEDVRYKVVDNRGSIFDKLIGLEFKKIIKKIKKYHKNVNSVLDFGSGKGKFLSLTKETWRSIGIETSESRSKFAREKYGLEIQSNYYSSGKINGGPFSVITMFHVLEHLHTPRALLRNLLSNNFKNDGLLVIEVPNLNSWQANLARANWLQLDAPRHLNHFTKDSLINLLERIGYKPICISYFSLHVGILGMMNSILGLIGYKGDIIHELKSRRRIKLYILLGSMLPIVYLTELLASSFNKGGIIRIYAKSKSNSL